ncbi:MAG: PAS domain S-box protein [Candidatus Hodarchaeota archaeon]
MAYQKENFREKYRDLFEYSLDLIYLHDLKGTILDANNTTLTSFGYNQEDLSNISFIDLIDNEQVTKFFNALKEIEENGKSLKKYVYKIKRKDGNYLYIKTHGIPLRKNDVIYAILNIGNDITERMIKKKTLKESEERYRLFLENANDLISIINEKFEFKYINEKVHKKLMGYSNEDLIGKYVLKFIHPDDVEKVNEAVNKALESAEANVEIRFRNKKGDYIWLEVRGKVFFDNNDQKGLLISRDISERKNTEQRLKESAEKYRLITENANDLIVILDEKFKVEYVNEQVVSKFWGYSKEEIVGKSSLEFIHPDDHKIAIESLKKGFIDGAGSAEIRLKNKMGDWLWFECLGNIFLNTKGESKALIICRDVDEKYKTNQTLKESEEKYRLISENANDLIVILNNKFIVEYVNEQVVSRLWGYSGKEIVSKSGLEFIHPDDHIIALEAFRKALIDGVGYTEIRLKNKIGNWLWFQISGTKFLNNKGEVKLLIIGRDVNERYTTEQKLKNSERDLKERVKELTCLYELSKLLENPNLSLEEIIKKTLNLILSACKFPNSTCVKIIFNTNEFKTSNFMETEYELSMSIEVQKKELNIKLYHLDDKPFLKEEENLIMDIGKRLKAIIEKIQAEDKLRQFISLVSHELRNPISVLVQTLNNLEKYKDKISKEMKIKLNEALSRNVKLLFDLVEDLLITSRIDEKRIKLIWREYRPYQIIRDLIELMNPIREMKEITIELNIDKELQLFGDYRRISQIFRILLDNALKYSYEKSKIIINTVDHYKGKYNSQEIDGVLFQFKDFGLGISEEDLPHLFERFFRARNVETISGTGLGLAIAKELINLHYGEIFVESKYGIGTTFSVFLPRLEKFLENEINGQLISIK